MLVAVVMRCCGEGSCCVECCETDVGLPHRLKYRGLDSEDVRVVDALYGKCIMRWEVVYCMLYDVCCVLLCGHVRTRWHDWARVPV
jgi:hypothetical protein